MSDLVAEVRPKLVLDLATGSGDLALAIKNSSPGTEVVAADFCLPMLVQAQGKTVPNLIQADGLALPFADCSFDAVTISFGLRNMADWRAGIIEMRRVLKPGGVLFIMDFSLPANEPLRGLYRFYLHRVLPCMADWATGRRGAYEYLGGSIESFPSGGAMCHLLQSAGLACEKPVSLAMGAVTIYRAARRSD